MLEVDQFQLFHAQKMLVKCLHRIWCPQYFTTTKMISNFCHTIIKFPANYEKYEFALDLHIFCIYYNYTYVMISNTGFSVLAS